MECVLQTREYLLGIPRTQEESYGFGCNAMGFLGSLFCVSESELERLQRIGCMEVLRAAVMGDENPEFSVVKPAMPTPPHIVAHPSPSPSPLPHVAPDGSPVHVPAAKQEFENLERQSVMTSPAGSSGTVE